MQDSFVKTDYRKFEVRYSEGFLSNIIFLKLTQLELLKIRQALIHNCNKSLSSKITKLILLVDNDKNETTDFERKIPRGSNGERVSKWQDLQRI